MDVNVLRRFVDNIIFAMNLTEEVPEHIKEEMMRSYHPDVVKDFNDEIDRKLRPRLGRQGRQQQQSEDFFNEIVGYVDIKKLLMRCIQSDSMHVILDGPPASAKSLFLYEMQKNLEEAYFVDCTNASGPGLVDYLFKNDVRYLLLDEVEKMSISDQNVLLNLLETGILTSTKVKKTGSKRIDVSVYATTNDINALSKPFRSRMLSFSLPEYTEEKFKEIAIRLLNRRYGHDEELALTIADTKWNKIGSKDVRDMLQVGRLSDNLEDVDFVATTLQKYKRKNEEEDEY